MKGNLFAKLGIASGTSITLTEALSLDSLWSALLSLAVSIVTVLAIDGLNLLKAWIHNKQRKLDDTSKEE